MLASVLALAIGLGSLALYAIAFLLPTLHRKSDFLWSGVGLFYALVLWVCAGQIRGGVLLGQTASVTLLGWFGWQMLKLRWELIPATERPPLPSAASAPELFNTTLAWVKARVTGKQAPPIPGRGQQPLQRSVSPGRGPGPKPGRSTLERQQPVAPRYLDLDSLDGLPEYELVEPEPMLLRAPKPMKIQPPEPVVEAVEAEPVEDSTEELSDEPASIPAAETETDPAAPKPPAPAPVPSVQPSTLQSRTKAAPASSPVETAQAIFTSLKEGAQQLWRSLSGRKPPRPMIVLDRTKSATPPPATPAEGEDDFDVDFDTDPADTTLNHEGELASEATTAVIPEEAIAIEENVAEMPDSGVDASGEPEDDPMAEVAEIDAAVTGPDLEVETEEAIASHHPVEASVDEWDDAIAPLDPEIETISEPEPADDLPVPADEPVDAIADTVEIADPTQAEAVPVLVRPNPPDPELVAEAIADAAEKDLPADPPDPATDAADPEEIHPA